MIILLQNLTSFNPNGDNKARDEASSPNDGGGTLMDLIDTDDNEDSSNGLEVQIFLTGKQELNLLVEDQDNSC